MRRVSSVLREPAMAGLVLLAGLLLFSWPFWSTHALTASSFCGNLAYFFGVWVLLIIMNSILGMAWQQPSDSPDAVETSIPEEHEEDSRV